MPVIGTRGSASSIGFGKYSSKTLSGSLPPDYVMWFDPASLAILGEGTSITTWVNKGSLGSSFDLYNPTSFPGNSSVGSVNVAPPTKTTISGFPCAAFIWNGTITDPTKGWAFRAQLGAPTDATKYWYILGNSSNGKTPNPITYFSVYSTTTGNFGHWGNYVTSPNIPTGIDGGYNISSTYVVGNTFTLCDKSDIGAGNISTVNVFTNTITSFGYRYSVANGTGYVYQNKNSAALTLSVSNPSSFCLSPWGIGMARLNPNTGYLFEQVAWNRTLTDDEIISVRNYFAAKYGGTAAT